MINAEKLYKRYQTALAPRDRFKSLYEQVYQYIFLCHQLFQERLHFNPETKAKLYSKLNLL